MDLQTLVVALVVIGASLALLLAWIVSPRASYGVLSQGRASRHTGRATFLWAPDNKTRGFACTLAGVALLCLARLPPTIGSDLESAPEHASPWRSPPISQKRRVQASMKSSFFSRTVASTLGSTSLMCTYLIRAWWVRIASTGSSPP